MQSPSAFYNCSAIAQRPLSHCSATAFGGNLFDWKPFIKKNHPEYIEAANSFLMMPDFFNFLLTGQKANEYTNATTTQLVNAKTFDWDNDLLDIFKNNGVTQ